MRVKHKLDRGIVTDCDWDYAADDIRVLRPGAWVGTKAMEYMAAIALRRAWRDRRYILVDPCNWQSRWEQLEAKGSCRGITKWDMRVNMFAGGGWSLHAVVHPVYLASHWSLVLIFHPNRVRQWLGATEGERDRMRSAGQHTIILHVDSLRYTKHDTDVVAGKWIRTMAFLLNTAVDTVKEAVKIWA
eukprot:jgi/Ulvmu1/8471/UM044_0004.1